ncbi:MAG: hypothetical protein L0Z53_05505 [Acidobacteriales bacterium]|nr:hypothetical protein [Terriglobales bacterium]
MAKRNKLQKLEAKAAKGKLGAKGLAKLAALRSAQEAPIASQAFQGSIGRTSDLAQRYADIQEANRLAANPFVSSLEAPFSGGRTMTGGGIPVAAAQGFDSLSPSPDVGVGRGRPSPIEMIQAVKGGEPLSFIGADGEPVIIDSSGVRPGGLNDFGGMPRAVEDAPPSASRTGLSSIGPQPGTVGAGTPAAAAGTGIGAAAAPTDPFGRAQMSPLAAAETGSEVENLRRVYGGLREAGLRILGQKGFGRAPSGHTSSFLRSSQRDQAEAETDAFRKGLGRTYEQGLQALNYRTGQQQLYDPLRAESAVLSGGQALTGAQSGAAGTAGNLAQTKLTLSQVPGIMDKIRGGIGLASDIAGLVTGIGPAVSAARQGFNVLRGGRG